MSPRLGARGALSLVAVGDDVRLLEERVTDLSAERLLVNLQAVDFLAGGIVDRQFDHLVRLSRASPALRFILRVPVFGGTGQDSTR